MDLKKTVTACISVIALATVCIFSTPVLADDVTDETSEYGYIFKLKDDNVQLMGTDIKSIDDGLYWAKDKEEIQNITQDKEVEYIVEDKPLETYSTYCLPNDEFYPQEWQFDACHVDTYIKHGINGEGVRVGILDTGINREQVDFVHQNIDNGFNAISYLYGLDEIRDKTNDYNGHGTKVTSVIAAEKDNRVGMTGVLDKCTIVPMNLYNTETRIMTVSSLLFGLKYAAFEDLDVLNISSGATDIPDSVIETMNKYIDILTEDGTIVIAAAGNDGKGDNEIVYPANCRNVIAVGAVEPRSYTFAKCDFSSANKTVWVSAPGKNMIIAKYDRDTGMSSFTTDSGTSFAAPMVAAAAGGAKQINPDISTDDFKQILKETSRDIDLEGYDYDTGYGMVDFKAIYEYMNGPELIRDNELTSDLVYDPITETVTCTITNKTGTDNFNTLGILAIYEPDGRLYSVMTAKYFYVREPRVLLVHMPYMQSMGAKFFVWTGTDLSLQPYVGAECSTLKLDGV